MPSSEKAYVIELNLTEQDRATLDEIKGENEWSIDETIEKIVKSLSAGGLLISPQVSARLAELIESEDDLIEIVEKAKNREGSAHLFYWKVDPAWLPAIREVGRHRGWNEQQVIQEMMDYAMDQGLVFFLPEEQPRIRFTKDGWEKIKKILGTEHPTGAELISWLEKHSPKAAKG